jgi:ABC-2 type transport system ATP-binding protein
LANDVMIEAQGLTKRFGNFRALDKVSFKVKRGEVVGFLGPNGAGKSTTMRILTCFISSTEGTAKVHGVDVFDDPLEVRRKLGYLPQRAPLYGEMSVWEYLRFTSEMRGLDFGAFKKRMKRIVEVCGLANVLGKDIRNLSHGYRQRVGLGQALVHDPPILILDEPTSDLDPNEKAEVIRYIKEIGKERTILLSTHNLPEVEAACARAIIVSKGRVVADGGLDDIRARSGKVRYVVTVDEKKAIGDKRPPSAEEVQTALKALPGVSHTVELPTDERSHTFQLTAGLGTDIRAEIFRLAVDKGWLLLESRRETQTLEDVFKALTRGDERSDRGRPLLGEDVAEDLEEEEDEDEDESDEDEDEPADDEAKEPTKGAAAAKAATKAASKEDEEEEDDDEDEESDEEDDDEDEESDDESEEEEPKGGDKKPAKKG